MLYSCPCFVLYFRFHLHFMVESLETSAVTVGVFSSKSTSTAVRGGWVPGQTAWFQRPGSKGESFDDGDISMFDDWCGQMLRLGRHSWWIVLVGTVSRQEKDWNPDLNVLLLGSHAKEWCWCAVLWSSKESSSYVEPPPESTRVLRGVPGHLPLCRCRTTSETETTKTWWKMMEICLKCGNYHFAVLWKDLVSESRQSRLGTFREWWWDVMSARHGLHGLQGLGLVEALRIVLATFRLPGEVAVGPMDHPMDQVRCSRL